MSQACWQRGTALATVDDSLQMAPVITDSIPSGQIVDRTFSLPTTSLARLTLFSTDAHLTLVDPNGTTITVADTSAATGITFYETSDPGLEGFQIVAPQPGTWTMRVITSSSAAGQRIAGIAEFASGNTVQLSVLTNPIYPGNVIRVRGQFVSGGAPRTDVSWTCTNLRPDGVTTSFVIYDDGVHGDSLAGDGVYGNTVTPVGGGGEYVLTATASASGVGPLATVAYCELADVQDLVVHSSDIQLSKNVPQPGDSLTVYATVHNNSTAAAIGVTVEIRDLRTTALLGSSIVDFAAGGSVVVQAPWVPVSPDSNELQVQVSPNVLDESDYTNNTAKRLIVLGSPVSVGRGGESTRLRFEPPYPNPTSGGVVFSFKVPEWSAGALDIYDVAGRRVREWRWTSLPPGGHSVEWDGRGTSGQRPTPGVYLCRLKVGDEKLQRRIVLRR